jgi:capsular exopolysaccharide synthesis family protein
MPNTMQGGYPQKPVSAMWSKVRVQIKRYYAVLNRFGWLLPLTISVGICLSAWVVSQMPPDYISEGRMLVGGQYQTQTGAAYIEQLDNYYGTQIELMQSLEVQKGALLRVQTLHPDLHPEMASLTVNQQPHASVFNLRLEAESPAYAKAYLDATMDEYIEVKRKLRLQSSDSTTLAIQDELAHVEKDVEASDAEMHDFQQKNNLGFLEQQGNDAADYLAKKNRELSDLKSEYNLLQMLDLDQNLDRQRVNAAAVQASAQGSTATDASGNPDGQNLASMGPVADYQKAKQELELLKAQRADLSKNLRPAHPTIVALDREIEKENNLIETLRAQSVDALKTRRDSIQIQIQNTENVITEQQAKALDLSGRIAEFNRIKTKSDRAKEEYEKLLSSMTSVTVTKNIDQDQVMIMERASEAVSIKPGWITIIAIGLVGGLLVGLIILFCIDQLDDRMSSFLELQTNFQEIILGQIPRENFKDDAALLRHNDDRLALLEAFRSLRSSLIFLPVEGTRPKTLIMTSALPNEGKTTLSANLAITLAFSGARTLVVDADMRRGKLSNLFGVTEGNGLSNILLGTMSWREVMLQTTVENLSLVPCGPPLKHPAEHLLGKVADQFLKDVYDQFDYVIFDSPPVTLLDDTLSLAPKIDGALLVVRFGVSSVRTTRRAIELLEQRQTNILGMICNDVHLSESEANYGYYYRQTAAAYAKDVRTPVA